MKIVIGAALIAAAVTAAVMTGGVAAVGAVGLMAAVEGGGILSAAILSTALMGAEMMMSGIAQEFNFGAGSGMAVRGKAASDWIAVFGRQRIGGAQVDCSVSGEGNRWLWEVFAHACHPIESYDHIYLNGQEAFLIAGTNGLQGNTIGLPGTSDFNNTGTPGNVQQIQATDLNWQQYSNFYYDGNARFWISRYDGTQTQADPFYAANCFYSNGGPHWPSTSVLNDTAYSILRYWWNANWGGGPPSVTQDVHGCNQIYDPRLDPSPGVNTTTPAYLIYTANAALVLAYYMTNTKFGAGFAWAEINIEQLIAAANVCDEQIPLANPQTINYQGINGADASNNFTVTAENQFEINGCIDSSQQSGSVINTMLSAMEGSLSYVGGQWNIFPGVWYGNPTATINTTAMIAPMSYAPKKKARDLFNEVRAQFISPAAFTTTMGPGIDVYQCTSLFNNFNSQWKKTDMVPYAENLARNYALDQWLEQDGGIKYITNVNYPLTISHACCQRLSKIKLRRNRWQGTGQLTLSLANYNITPVDNIAMDYPRYGWTQKLFTVVSAALDPGVSGDKLGIPTYKLGIQETDPSIYEWCVGGHVLLNDISQGGTVITDELANTPTGMSQSGPTAALCAPVTNLLAESGSTTMVRSAVGIATPAILVTWTHPTVSTATGSGTYSAALPDTMVVNGGHYNIQISTDGAVTWNAVTTIGGQSDGFQITGLSDGTIAYVRVQAVRQNGLSSEWNQVGPVTVSATLLNVSAADVYYGAQGNLLTVDSMMPAQAGADVTAQQAVVYTGSSESIVPNGTFVLNNAQGWLLIGASYSVGGGSGTFNDAIVIAAGAAGSNTAGSPVFSVKPGATYQISVTGFVDASGGPNPLMRVGYSTTSPVSQVWAATATQFTLPFAYDGEATYNFEWTAPAGVISANIQIFPNGTPGNVYIEGVSCVPYGAAAQWGADVTQLNTAANTSAVGTVPASSVTLAIGANGNVILKNVATVGGAVTTLTSTFADLVGLATGDLLYTTKGNPVLIAITTDFSAVSSGGAVTSVNFTPGTFTAPINTPGGTPSIDINILGDGGGATAFVSFATTSDGTTDTMTGQPVQFTGGSGYSYASASVTVNTPTGWTYSGAASGSYPCDVSVASPEAGVAISGQVVMDGVVVAGPVQVATDVNGRARYQETYLLPISEIPAGSHSFGVQAKYDGSTSATLTDGSFNIIELG